MADENCHPTDYLEVSTTVSSENEAHAIAGQLVQRRLAACVQITGPITSHYRWEGAIERSAEYRLTAKSSAAIFERLRLAILELHSYDVPEILAVPIVDGHGPYLEWLTAQIGD